MDFNQRRQLRAEEAETEEAETEEAAKGIARVKLLFDVANNILKDRWMWANRSGSRPTRLYLQKCCEET